MDTEKKLEDLIFEDLLKKGRGRIFFAQEFYDRYPGSSVRFALSRWQNRPSGTRSILPSEAH